ncbi:MAG: hypothetical protein QM765_03185 [Myxococcales bacterium]
MNGKDKDVLGLVIAQRTYWRGRQRVVVKVGQPQKDGDDWFCPYLIEGLDDGKVRRTWGVDSFQALQLVMQAIRAHLLSHAAELSLFGAKGELGISKVVPDCFGKAVNEKLENVVEAAVEALAVYGEAVSRRHGTRPMKGTRR